MKPDRDPLEWIKEEIQELRKEELFSDTWALEHLDVLGCVARFGDAHPQVVEYAARTLKNEEWNQGIQEMHYNRWATKQRSRSRKPISVAELMRAKFKIFHFVQDMK